MIYLQDDMFEENTVHLFNEDGEKVTTVERENEGFRKGGSFFRDELELKKAFDNTDGQLKLL